MTWCASSLVRPCDLAAACASALWSFAYNGLHAGGEYVAIACRVRAARRHGRAGGSATSCTHRASHGCMCPDGPVALGARITGLHRQGRPRRQGRQQGQEDVARLLAAAARLHARPAVNDAVLRVVLALVAAHLAGLHAGLEGSACRRGIEGSLAREDPAGRQADVGAIEAEADAADHRLHLLLAQVSIGVGGAGLGAVEACPDALHERVLFHGRLAGIGVGYRCGVCHVWSFLSMRMHWSRHLVTPVYWL